MNHLADFVPKESQAACKGLEKRLLGIFIPACCLFLFPLSSPVSRSPVAFAFAVVFSVAVAFYLYILVFVSLFPLLLCCHVIASDAEAQFRREESQRIVTEENLAAVRIACFVSLFVSHSLYVCHCPFACAKVKFKFTNTNPNPNPTTKHKHKHEDKVTNKKKTKTRTKRQTPTQTHPRT
jgi:hypothetical protein